MKDRTKATEKTHDQPSAPDLCSAVAFAPEPSSAHPAEPDIRQELDTMRERHLRLASDFDNYRKRMARDAQRCGAEQKEAFVRDMLPVLDNLERGLACSDMVESDRFRTGVHSTLQQATHVLGLHGFIPQDDLGQEFDPRFHEAVAVRAVPGHPQGTILEVCQRGWRREGVPFRPAKVIVNVKEDRNKNEKEE